MRRLAVLCLVVTSSITPVQAGQVPSAKQAQLPNDPGARALQWPFKVSGFPAAWGQAAGGTKVIVAVVDSGVSSSMELPVLARGFNELTDSSDARDDFGHGTIVANVIAARANNKIGGAGVCPTCLIMPVKVVSQAGFGTADLLTAGILWAAAHGAKVINCSITQPADEQEVDAAIAEAVSEGAVVVLAAGNSGSDDPARNGYPAGANPEAIRVAGVNQTGQLYNWSNRGSWVDVAAPGDAAQLDEFGKLKVGAEGTSVAAPFVAGVAGLILSKYPQLTPAQVKRAIVASAVPVAGQAFGRINASGALSFAGAEAA